MKNTLGNINGLVARKDLIVHGGRMTSQVNCSIFHSSDIGFAEVDLAKFHDVHILHPLGEPNNWKRTLPLLKKMFNTSDVEWSAERSKESWHFREMFRFERIHKQYARIAAFPSQTTPSPRTIRRHFVSSNEKLAAFSKLSISTHFPRL